MAHKLFRNGAFAGTLAVALGAGVSAVALQGVPGQPPSEPPSTPPDQPRQDEQRERPTVTHSGTVVDLYTYLDKIEQERRTQRERPGNPGERTGPQEDDEGIDWSDGDYKQNIEAGVPVVLMVEEESPWGQTEAQPHILVFDPDDSASRDAYKTVKENAGDKVEIAGEISRDGAMRGLRVIVIDDMG